MKLFKKLIAALSVLMVIGMMAACGGDAGGGTTTREGWDIYYNGQSVLGAPEEDEEPMTWEDVQIGITMYGLTEGTDYSVNQSAKILTLTKSGYDKMEAFENIYDDDDDDVSYYTIKHNGTVVTSGVPETALIMLPYLMNEGADYSMDRSTKTITLTDTGMEKWASMTEED